MTRAAIVQRTVHGHNSATELSQSVASTSGTVYLRQCILLTISYSSTGSLQRCF